MLYVYYRLCYIYYSTLECGDTPYQKNSVNSSGDAPSPYFTPRFARNSSKSPESSSTHIPLD